MSFDSSKHISKIVSSIPPSGIRKFFDIAAERPDAISLSIGEPDFVTPEIFRSAAIRSLNEGKTAYTSNAGLLELRQAVAQYTASYFGVAYDYKKEIIITVGGSEAVDISIRSLLNPGDEILIPEPCYVSYKPCAQMAGAKVITVPTYIENDFKLSVDDLEKHVTPKTKVLLMSYPSNPTGAIMDRQTLEAVAKFAVKHDLVVITDEIYAELTYDTEHCSIAAMPGMQERTVLISGVSKAFAMTGWRIGYVCAPVEIARAIAKVHQYVIMCAPTISQYAALEGVLHGYEEVMKMTAEYKKRKEYIIPRFREMGLPLSEPHGAFYAFPSIKHTGMSSEEFCMKLLEDENVAVVPGNAFGDCGEGFFRCSYATSMERLEKALDRMERFLKKF